MKGSQSVKFSELFADTCKAHGLFWAWTYYVEKRGMADWEFTFWARATNCGNLPL